MFLQEQSDHLQMLQTDINTSAAGKFWRFRAKKWIARGFVWA